MRVAENGVVWRENCATHTTPCQNNIAENHPGCTLNEIRSWKIANEMGKPSDKMNNGFCGVATLSRAPADVCVLIDNLTKPVITVIGFRAKLVSIIHSSLKSFVALFRDWLVVILSMFRYENLVVCFEKLKFSEHGNVENGCRLTLFTW